jgi:hypothetical protein
MSDPTIMAIHLVAIIVPLPAPSAPLLPNLGPPVNTASDRQRKLYLTSIVRA